MGNRAKEGGRGGRGVVTRTYESNYRRVRPRWEAPTRRVGGRSMRHMASINLQIECGVCRLYRCIEKHTIFTFVAGQALSQS